MVETGRYNVNKKRDTSFKSFICALLAFLAMLILISLLLYALRNRGKGSDDLGSKNGDGFNSEFLKGKNITKKGNKKLAVSTTPKLLPTTTQVTTTTLSSTSSTDKDANEIRNPTTDESTTTIKSSTTGKSTSESNEESTNTIPDIPPGETDITKTPVAPPVPTTCKNGICKRAASSMLAIMNHDDKLNPCEDYYKFICEGPEQNDKHAFFHDSFKGFIKKINEVTPASEKYMVMFADFYKSCKQFGNSNNRLERLKCLNGTGGDTLTKSITNAILAQALPFFDIGLNTDGTNFKLEVILPGLSYLKTTLKDWSLMEKLRDICINEQSDNINQNIEFGKISTDIKTCIGERVKNYVKYFTEEMKQLSALPGFKFLDANFITATQTDDLIDILNVVQESLAAYRNTDPKKPKETTLSELKTKYDFGLDWIELFKSISNNSLVDENTVVYQSEHIENVFNKLIEKKANLQPLVDLWYNIELYENIVIEKEIDHSGFHCLEITSELMPEVSSAIISELNVDKKDLYEKTKNLMNNIILIFKTHLQDIMTSESSNIIQDRLAEIEIKTPEATPKVDGQNYSSVFEQQDPYPKKMVSLISNFRKTLYSMHEKVVGDQLLKYFVNAFATKPKSFPPSRDVVIQPGFFYGKSTKLPTYIQIAKLGLPLTMEISRHFTRNDFKQPLDQKEKILYEEMEKTFDTKYLMNKINYTVENVDFEVEDATGNHLSYDNIIADNMAFRMATETFTDDKKLEYLPFLEDYTREQSFIIIALQEYCYKNTIVDFVGDYYKNRLPAPLMFKNILKNSEFYSKAFNCTEPFERKQFLYTSITSSTP